MWGCGGPGETDWGRVEGSRRGEGTERAGLLAGAHSGQLCNETGMRSEPTPPLGKLLPVRASVSLSIKWDF